jgi:hypothetical protein
MTYHGDLGLSYVTIVTLGVMWLKQCHGYHPFYWEWSVYTTYKHCLIQLNPTGQITISLNAEAFWSPITLV